MKMTCHTLVSDVHISGVNYTQSTSLITSAPLWSESTSSVMSYIPKCYEDYSRRVKHELGFEFPPVMGQWVEQLIGEIWTKVKDQRYMYISHYTGLLLYLDGSGNCITYYRPLPLSIILYWANPFEGALKRKSNCLPTFLNS